jgi:prepilin-type processing-associated H-X9-DG protein
LPADTVRRIERLASITDGLSNTILAGEKVLDPSVQTGPSWYWDEPFFLGGSGSTARRGLGLMRDAVGNDYKTHWGAAHPGGVHFLFGDGSVRMVRYELSWMEFTALLTPSACDLPPTVD